jgi:membrane protein YqaA with SNARE-associated domain
MGLSLETPTESHEPLGQPRDDIRLRRWFAGFALLFLAFAVWLGMLLADQDWPPDRFHDFTRTLAETDATVKILFMLLYVSLACTFLPLPTGWVVSAVATQGTALAAGWSDDTLTVGVLTTLVVAVVGAAGSTAANLNDYHLLTLMLRSRRISKVRHHRTYQAAVNWFEKSPFFLLLVFNILPLPVDVVRILAASHRYPRLPFVAANFAGRLIRYSIIAGLTFWISIRYPQHQWLPSIALLALAAVLGLGKLAGTLRSKAAARRQGDGTFAVADATLTPKNPPRSE